MSDLVAKTLGVARLMAKNRLFKNYVSDMDLQYRFAGTVVLLFIIMVSSVVFYSHLFLENFMMTLFETPGIPEGATANYQSMLGDYLTGLGVILSVLCTLGVFFVVIHTHRIAGAKFALIRHFQDRLHKFDFEKNVKLRDGDYLHDLAFELNKFVALLKAKVPVLPPKITQIETSEKLASESSLESEKIEEAIDPSEKAAV